MRTKNSSNLGYVENRVSDHWGHDGLKSMEQWENKVGSLSHTLY